jgi:hypothetical protein
MDPIVLTHALITVTPDRKTAIKTGHYAIIHLCAGPGNENFFALLYGKVVPGEKRSPGIILPMLAIRGDNPRVVPQLGGKLMNTIAKFAGMAIDAVLKKEVKGMKPGRQYFVSLTGEVELLPEEK